MPSRSATHRLSICFALSCFAAGCVTVYNPATERRESYLIDTAGEVKLGEQMDQELHQKMKFVTDPAMNRRLNTIGSRIAKVSDRQDVAYHFQIVDDKELNAFATPGGFVYVNSGLMRAANDDELAGVIAHEVGHIAARHSVKQIQALLGYQLVLGVITGGSDKSTLNSAMGIVFDLANLGYSRKDELMADKLSVRYVRRAGYSPIGMITFFKKLQKEAESKGPNVSVPFLSSHPGIEQRIALIEQEMHVSNLPH